MAAANAPAAFRASSDRAVFDRVRQLTVILPALTHEAIAPDLDVLHLRTEKPSRRLALPPTQQEAPQ
jgi:hypothetical protein